MTAHFLQTAAARTLSIRSIYKAGEEMAYKTFREMRWSETGGEAVCPKCGYTECGEIKSRRQFQCKACRAQFSVTSGTIFSNRKMDFTDLLAAIAIVVNAAKGISALQLSRDLDCQHKTAWILAHKIREAIAAETTDHQLDDTVEVDGAYFGGHIRPENLASDRKDRRLSRYQTGKRRVVVALREREGRILTGVFKREAQGVKFAADRVEAGSKITADEATHWDNLEGLYELDRINHTEGYSIDGIHTNMVESFFSRLRKMVSGQHHWVSPKYLHQYAAHAAWLEDHRRESNGALAARVLNNAMAAPVSRTWAGY